MTVIVHQRPLEATRTSNKSCKWIAEAIVGGKTYAATSRMAPANDIARQLVKAGIPDSDMLVYTFGLRGCFTWQSFHKAAKRTVRESGTTPVKSIPWVDPAALKASLSGTNRPNRSQNDDARGEVPPGHSNTAFD